MIKLPIKPLTPPIPVTKPHKLSQQNAAGASGSGSSGGSGSGSGGSHGAGGGKIPSFETLFAQMLAQYMPETVEFTPLSEEVLRDTIRNWLRPAYEQAIQSRREQTERINAELDADAWSRGMGQSTYLSDVKERQLENESRDVDALESDYASTLAQHLLNAIEEQQTAQLEVDKFNAEQINHANEQAAAAAQALYQAYLSGASHSGNSSPSKANGEDAASGMSVAEAVFAGRPDGEQIDYRTAENLVARMSREERSKLYFSYDGTYAKLRYDILRSLGKSGFNALKQKYPA